MLDDKQSSDPSADSTTFFVKDVISGGVVFLVALPLCLGIALASGAEPFSGLLAGIVGGLVVAAISGSHTSVSGPAAGLTAIVSAQIANLGTFDAFLLAVVIAGLFQIVLGVIKAGSLSAFVPSSVINGLLAAIGVILILKQIPHVLGHDTDPEGEMSFRQPDHENTFSELLTLFEGEIHNGAILIGLLSIAVLVGWKRVRFLRNSLFPAQLAVVLLGVALNELFRVNGGPLLLDVSHLVKVPVAESFQEFASFLRMPDFSQWNNQAVYVAAITIALVASLETLLNLEAVDKLDKFHRETPPSRELIAQGCGNLVAGMIGGLPVTAVIVRGSVNIAAGNRTKLSAIVHGALLAVCVGFFPMYLNLIPLASLAAILLVTGFHLASPALFRQMWNEGRYQFIPFIVTLLAIVFTDLLIGVVVGLVVSICFILNSNLRHPIRRIVETHIGGDIVHIELANQVSFLNRAALNKIFNDAVPGTEMLIDAKESDYIDPDILSLIREFKEKKAPARGVSVSLRGFREKYDLQDDILFADYTTRELQDQATPESVLEILIEGNRRFRSGNRLARDFNRQVLATSQGQTPLAVVLSCIDSRTPAELIFDLGLGDIFSVRVAGNVIGTKTLASMEYGVAVAGVKLVLVVGHTSCGAVTSSVELACANKDAAAATGCAHLPSIVSEILPSIKALGVESVEELTEQQKQQVINEVAKANVQRTVQAVIERSACIRERVEQGRVRVVGALYDIATADIEILPDRPA